MTLSTQANIISLMAKMRISKELILSVALEILEKKGISGLTMANIAGKCGIKPPSLYKHVCGIDQILDGLYLKWLQGLRDVLERSAVGKSGKEAITEIANGFRLYAHCNPGLYSISQPTHAGKDSEIEAIAMDIMKILGLVFAAFCPKKNVLNTIRTFRSFLHGFVDLEMKHGFGLPGNLDESFRFSVNVFLTGIQTHNHRRKK